jgi:hypothetical protein
MGVLATVGFVLAVRVAGDPERPPVLRAAVAAAGVPIGLGLYLTFARGALAALAVGLLVLVALAPAVRVQLQSIVVVGCAAGAAALVASFLPSVEAVDGRGGDTAQGLVMLLVIVLLGTAVPVAVLRRPRRRLPGLPLPASRPATVLSASALVLLAGGIAVATLEGKPQSTSPAQGADPARLGSIDTNRYRYWEVAVREFAEQPVAGLGSGGFSVEWLKERDRVDRASDAHSLYLETAAELGVVGLGFLLLFIGGLAAATARLYGLAPAVVTGPAAGLAAWALHAGLDWDWEIPAATLPAIFLAAAVIAWSEER